MVANWDSLFNCYLVLIDRQCKVKVKGVFMSTRTIIIISLALIFIIPSCLLDFELLSIFNYIIQIMIILFCGLELLIAAEVLKPKNVKHYLVIIPAYVLLVGVLLIIINIRLGKLQPIAFATAHLELSIKPSKIDESKMDAKTFGDVELVKGKVSHPFMQLRNASSWGRKGLVDTLHLDYAMDWFSEGYGRPFDFIDKYETIGFAVWMLPAGTEIIEGRCVFTFNGIIRREIKIPSQKVPSYYSVYSNPEKKPTIYEVK